MLDYLYSRVGTKKKNQNCYLKEKKLFDHTFRIGNVVLLQRLTRHTLTSLPSSGAIMCELDGWAVFIFAALNLLKIVFITKIGGCLVQL